MSFVDPRINPPDPEANDQPYLKQSPYYNPPNSFSIPPSPANPFIGQKSNRRRAPRLGLLISVIILIALMFVGYTAIAPSFGPTIILVKPHPTLVINSDQYAQIDPPTISIHAGTDDSKIILRVISPGNIPLSGSFGINGFQQNSDGSVIILNGDPVRGRRKFDVTVPANTDLKVDTNSANINMTGITGQVIFTTHSGAITLTNCHVTGISILSAYAKAITVTQSALDGQVMLKNYSGAITLTNSPFTGTSLLLSDYEGAITVTQSALNGQVTLDNHLGAITLTNSPVTGTSLLSDYEGAITVTQSALDGQVTLNNYAGPITFNGSIGSTGTYTFVNYQGSIDATFPQKASFHIDTKTYNGSITTDYAGIRVQNKEIHADVGSPPRALLSLKTYSGTITLHMQKGA